MPFVFYYYGEKFVSLSLSRRLSPPTRLLSSDAFSSHLFRTRIRSYSTFSPTGKPTTTPTPAPIDAEKTHQGDQRVQPTRAQSRHSVDEFEQEFGEEAGMEEQRAQDAELERRRSGLNVV